ncbi:MAG: V-type ATPase subunit [Oscillospiraceae bacterium]|jgi:V/A-type H+-transporting ATPase subunit C|nr:V-type ATPase subunit [Oscillospiraceae bacterium]MDE6996730.1 V-type ATPase subunit [Oscillospiraceae bacterium]
MALAKKKQLKDTDYLFISSYLRTRERNLLTAARMDRMIDAPTTEDAAKVLGEIGYSEFSPSSERELGAALASEREKVFQDLYRFVPDKAVVDVFKVKYDYHNLKALLKARSMGADAGRLLMDAGRVPTAVITRAVTEGVYDLLPATLSRAAREAAEVLGTTGDPQLADFILDRAYYAEMLSAAEATGSKFLTSYVQATIDASNLRSAVRTLRMKKGADLLKKVLVEGGTVAPERIRNAALGGSLEDVYRSTALRAAAELGVNAVNGGSLTAFEKACDDAVTAAAGKAKGVPFGVEAVIGYLVAKEIEFTAVRTIMSSRMAGIGGETIRERLREAYV